MKKIIDLLASVLIAFVIAMLLKSTVFAIPEIRMSSMEDTFVQGDRVLEIKFAYGKSDPMRGDIIVFDKEKQESGFVFNYIKEVKETFDMMKGNASQNHLIKRVIAVPGDEIRIEDGEVYINDQLLNELYIKGDTYTDVDIFSLEIPEGKVFVMGDNRQVSLDSRNLGLIDYKQIEGKAVMRVWPLNKIGLIKD